ncbi:DUF29 domain-containing protein [Neorhizobium galegae]|uniref:DUF29 domain-containing protein n=1 Tax=Neorhizobium galegae TaxID=399 RepID=A0A6A1TN98_NEOGA|nr:DUF29 family protein [Neorhizobium galegae]KAB1086162.1 DUF29 domain-containing protein [Neorhizobium galegae]
MTLYDNDYVAWTCEQADILRSMPGNSGLDIEHLIEEIESLGRSAIADLSSAIRRVLHGLIRRSIDPSAVSVEDIYSARADVIISADGGVWRHIDLDKVWRLARRTVDVDGAEKCPITIEHLISEDFDIERVVRLIRS